MRRQRDAPHLCIYLRFGRTWLSVEAFICQTGPGGGSAARGAADGRSVLAQQAFTTNTFYLRILVYLVIYDSG